MSFEFFVLLIALHQQGSGSLNKKTDLKRVTKTSLKNFQKFPPLIFLIQVRLWVEKFLVSGQVKQALAMFCVFPPPILSCFC